jgi:hypothetical protein
MIKITLDAPSLSFWIKKQQSLKEKVLQFVRMIAGNICYFFELSFAHPYIKQFFLREWPWKSQ